MLFTYINTIEDIVLATQCYRRVVQWTTEFVKNTICIFWWQNWKLYLTTSLNFQVFSCHFLTVVVYAFEKGHTHHEKKLVRYLFKVQPDMIEWHEMAISKQYLQFLWCQAMVTLPLQKAPKQQIRLNYYRY